MEDRLTLVSDRAAAATPDELPSLEALFRDHHQAVFRAAYRVSGCVHDAEDALQSVFLRLLKRTEQQAMGANPASYLCKAAINASLDRLRAKRRKPTAELDDGRSDPPADDSADSEAHRAEQRRHLRAALAHLPPRAAEIFALRYFEELGNAEIAAMLDTSTSSIAVTLHRARDRLQELLREFEGEGS